MHQAFYENGVKRVPIEVLETEFTELSLAIWVMDDGSADGSQLRLNTQSFTIEEVEALRLFLRAKLGLDTRLNIDKGKPRLRFSAGSMENLVKLIESNMHPSMLYKLPL